MMMPFTGDEYKAPSYKKYKSDKFEKNKQKVLMILSGIKQTSLKDADKKQLIEQIKKLVANY